MKGVIKMLVQGMDLEDMVQELVLSAVEHGEHCIVISEGVQELAPVVGYMGYEYELHEEDLIVRW